MSVDAAPLMGDPKVPNALPEGMPAHWGLVDRGRRGAGLAVVTGRGHAAVRDRRYSSRFAAGAGLADAPHDRRGDRWSRACRP